MKTYENIDISNTSYTNKDFGTIYPEMLDLTKDLTDRWDPSLSNESDPGVVLIKHGAFIADHNNYNIDKNTLENFAPSATQDKSMRNICEMNGYEPRYYQSACGTVTFILRTFPDGLGDAEWSKSNFNVPKFSLNVTSDDQSVNYVQVEEFTITGLNSAVEVKFVEGSMQTLTVNGDSTLTMDNIDSRYRLYFPESTVAENGVYIESVDKELGSDWSKVNYIMTRPLGQYIFSIDYDSDKGLPYVQFPDDIASIIGSGITVKYVRTSGENGNVAAGSLNTLVNNISWTSALSNTFTFTNDNFTITNVSSIINGKDPEDIDEMYNSFIHTVGTFETLVSCTDYSNAIYNDIDDYNNYLISNGYVTDKRTDYNYATNVISYDKLGQFLDSISIGDTPCSFTFLAAKPTDPAVFDVYFDGTNYQYYTGDGWKELKTLSFKDFTSCVTYTSPYDLFFYALRTFSMLDYSSKYYYEAIENSFKPATDETVKELKDDIEDYKSINHTYKDLRDNDVLCFKAYCPLKVSITTYDKVSKQVRNEILQSVYIALTTNFNARKMLFGEELVYDEVVDVIKGADTRIKKVDVSDFVYEPKVMYKSGEESVVTAFSDIFTDIVAKNVLAGRVALYEFEEEFNYEYGQSNTLSIDDPITVSTEVRLSMNEDTEVTLGTNEYMTIVSPRYSTTTSYGEYVNYTFSNLASPIYDGSLYKMSGAETLDLTYSVDGSVNKHVFYGAGTYIRLNGFDVSTSSSGTIATDKSIDICTENITEYRNTTVPCLWIRNTTTNYLFKEGENYTVLNQGEYFIVASRDFNTFTVYGTGTIIERYSSDDYYPALTMTKIDESTIEDSTFNASFGWFNYNISSDASVLTIYKSNIINLAEGSKVKFNYDPSVITSGTFEPMVVNNTWKYIDDSSEGNYVYTITYKLSGSDDYTTLALNTSDDEHFIRSRLDLKLIDKDPQCIENLTAQTSEFVYLKYTDPADSTKSLDVTIYATPSGSSTKQYIVSNHDINCVGDDNIDIQTDDLETLRFFGYEKLANPFVDAKEISYVKDTSGSYIYDGISHSYINSPTGLGTKYREMTDSSPVVNLPTFKIGDQGSYYTLTLGYETTISYSASTNGRTYALPIYLTDDSGIEDMVLFNVDDPGIDDGTGNKYIQTVGGTKVYDYSYGIKELNTSTVGGTVLKVPNNKMFVVTPFVSYTGTDTTFSEDISLTLKFNVTAAFSVDHDMYSNPVIKMFDPVVITGTNSAFGSMVGMDSVKSRIEEIVKNSDNPDVYIYWLYRPDNSMAIESDDWSDATVMFDKNNVVCDKTIVEIDLRNSNIDIAKAMRNYGND